MGRMKKEYFEKTVHIFHPLIHYSHIIIMIKILKNDNGSESNKYENIFQLKWHASRFLSAVNCLLVCQKTIMWPIYYFVFVINFDCMISIGLRFIHDV